MKFKEVRGGCRRQGKGVERWMEGEWGEGGRGRNWEVEWGDGVFDDQFYCEIPNLLVTWAPRSVYLALISLSSYTTSSLSTVINPPSGDLLADE